MYIHNVDEDIKKRKLLNTVGKLVQSLWETVQESLRILVQLPYDPAIPLLVICPKKIKSVC